MVLEPTFEMWATLFLTVLAVVAYASEWISIELTSVGVLVALLLLFHVTPLISGTAPQLGPEDILGGFSSPALIAVSALLVIGQAMVSTGALEGIARFLVWLSRGSFYRAYAFSLGYVTASSAFLNNTPIVIIFMPILRSIAERYGRSAGAVMMPLSFRRDPRRHADPDRHVDQSAGLGRARQARPTATRFLRPHGARAGAGACRRRLHHGHAQDSAAAGRAARAGDGRRQTVHRGDRRRAGPRSWSARHRAAACFPGSLT